MSENKQLNKNINLPNGNQLNVVYSEQFIARVKEHFKLAEQPDDNHIRLFLAQALSSAINKTET